jgi:hypothetical protein
MPFPATVHQLFFENPKKIFDWRIIATTEVPIATSPTTLAT